jgi:methenyltetrahydrofolate cyclohydrolase
VETIELYLHNLASADPVPGGGSAAAIVASTGAALVGMVARICSHNPAYDAHADESRRIVSESDELRARLERARAHDESAFARVVEAQALPKDTPERKTARRDALETALHAAAEAPLATAAIALDVVRLADGVQRIPNRNLASDVGCAAEFGVAALAACAYNVRVNHRYMRDESAIATQAEQLVRYEREATEILARVRAAVAAAIARP